MHRSPVAPARISLSAAGGWPFLITSAIGRLPASTLQLGLLMFVTGTGLGFGLGGLTVAAAGIGGAIGAPLVGRLVDRIGAFPVVFGALVLQTIGLLSILAVVAWAPNPALIVACAALIGAANPQIGPIARGRWSMLANETGRPDLIRLAMGYEGACDEAGFVLGPALAGILVGVLGPMPAMFVLLALTWIGEGVFIIYLFIHRAEWRRISQLAHGAASHDRFDMVALTWPLLACLAVGTVFGSTQTALASVFATAGNDTLTGIVYGCVGIGSAIVSVLIVRLVRVPLSARILVGGAVVAVAAYTMTVITGPVEYAVVGLLLGAAVGAIVVSSFARIEQVSPLSRINSAMTLGATCLTLGVSLGAATSGMLVVNPTHGFYPGIAAGVLALAVGSIMLSQKGQK